MSKTTSLICLLSTSFLAIMCGCTITATTDPEGSTGGSIGAGGVTGASGSAGAGGTTNTGAGGGGANDPCAIPETTPNDDRSHATPYTLNAQVRSCLQSDTDIDFYEFTTPASPAQGGFLQVQVTDVATTASIQVSVLSARDNGELGAVQNSTGGASVFVWFGAQPGATFRVSVGKYFSVTQPSSYVFTTTFTGVADTYEPNDNRGQAKPIPVNTAINGYFFAGYIDSTRAADEAWFDFYSVPLEAKHVKVVLEPPTDRSGEFALLDPNGAQVTSQYVSAEGAAVVYETDLTVAGTYYVNAHPWFGTDPRGTGSTVPNYFTQPYKLTVTQ